MNGTSTTPFWSPEENPCLNHMLLLPKQPLLRCTLHCHGRYGGQEEEEHTTTTATTKQGRLTVSEKNRRYLSITRSNKKVPQCKNGNMLLLLPTLIVVYQ
mmetsp:Transcript_52551/g.58751  ORF Transcript_52551/g.58751 Transcript_52551/m.58751 type:complete len:100 (-) Transcript_52551:174-473(-)